MGKNTVKRSKPASDLRQEHNASTNNDDSYRLKNQSPSELDELTKRLRRLERTNSNGNSDVYKFVLFFIMGVAMTVLLYPHVSKTIESFNHSQHSSNSERTPRKSEVDSFVDVGETPPERTGLGNPSKNDTAVQNDHVHNAVTDPTHDEGKNDRSQDKNAQHKSKNIPNGKPKREVEEDPLIGENDNDDSILDKDQHVVQDHVPTERVELFNMDADIGELPIKFIDESENENQETKQKENTRNTNKKDKPKSPRKKETGKTNKKKKSKKTTTDTEKTDKNDKNDSPDMPAEIRNYKPTFQKNIQPKKIFADGRRIPPMELLPQKPNNSSVKVWMFEEFLSEAECDGLMRVHKQHVEDQSKMNPILCFDSIATLRKHLQNAGKHNVRVTPRDFTEGTTCANVSFSSQLKTWLNGNWSYSTSFYPGESRFSSIFEQRVQQAMGLKPENGGKFQITSYPLGIGYKSHTDCTENTSDKRDRMATVLVYLDTVSEGGETDFQDLGIWVRPRKARALLWNNMNEEGECEPLSIHQAKQVLNGHKIILQRWYYYQSFYSLGKRPPEPPLPRREPGQPRVSCDEFEHGSCRWYDEWNFEHVLEYERQKYNLV